MCRIDSKETCFQADTGCPRTVINIRVIPENDRYLIVPVNFYVLTATGEPANVIGKKRCRISHGKYATNMDVLVTRDLEEDCLLGLDFLNSSPATRNALETLTNIIQTPICENFESFESEEKTVKSSNSVQSLIFPEEDTVICRVRIISKDEYNRLQSGNMQPSKHIVNEINVTNLNSPFMKQSTSTTPSQDNRAISDSNVSTSRKAKCI